MARREPIRTLSAGAALAAVCALAGPASAEAGYARRTLRPGSHGRDVKLFQKYLTRAGFRVAADGDYGHRTARGERRFEKSAGRRVDGRASRGEQRLVRRAAKAHGDGSGGASYRGGDGNPAATATLGPDGVTAIPPDGAPDQVKAAIGAANRITDKPYRYGGGHGDFEDSGYDCSGSVSYAMHGGGLLDAPLDSTGFESWGADGPGQWITVYANAGHAYAVIAGLRFDTSGGSKDDSGPRWRTEPASTNGYVVRHPAGL
jgi:cell wall-associated NlpC family hydrolase